MRRTELCIVNIMPRLKYLSTENKTSNQINQKYHERESFVSMHIEKKNQLYCNILVLAEIIFFTNSFIKNTTLNNEIPRLIRFIYRPFHNSYRNPQCTSAHWISLRNYEMSVILGKLNGIDCSSTNNQVKILVAYYVVISLLA